MMSSAPASSRCRRGPAQHGGDDAVLGGPRDPGQRDRPGGGQDGAAVGATVAPGRTASRRCRPMTTTANIAATSQVAAKLWLTTP